MVHISRIVTPDGHITLPIEARRRWNLERGGEVELLDIGFGVLVVPSGGAATLLDEVLPAEALYEAVASETDDDLRS